MTRGITLALTLSLAAITGCQAAEAVDQAVDCNDLCNRYADCFDTNYDRASCRDRCADVVENDARAANDCDTCLDGRSCAGAFACGTECYGLLP